MGAGECPGPCVCLCTPASTCVDLNATMRLYRHPKGHESPLVVIRETAAQVRVAAILVSADRSPQAQALSLRASG